jgi:hypothetical protein
LKAGHLYLNDNLNLKSGIYTIYEHYNNTNNINSKNLPINNIYDTFSQSNTDKYPYEISNNLIIINNTLFTYVGVQVNNISTIPSFLKIQIKPLKDSILNFSLYNPTNIEYVLSNCYGFKVTANTGFTVSIDLLNYYVSNPEVYNFELSHIQYPLLKDVTYDLEFIFNSDIYYCIQEQNLGITNIILA